jgi:SAM-dependent methyltransferase
VPVRRYARALRTKIGRALRALREVLADGAKLAAAMAPGLRRASYGTWPSTDVAGATVTQTASLVMSETPHPPARTWEDQIALNSGDEPTFVVLPPPGGLPDRVSWSVDPAKLGIDIEARVALDVSPIPVPEDREGYFGPRHFEYWLSGLETHELTLAICDRHGVERGSFVDFGAASGRVIRHMAAYETFETLWALDINWRHIMWMHRHLPASIRAIHTSSIPHLPLEDGSVDCLQAMSVFSHIEAFETAWLAEIRRILKPGGIAILSVVTEEQVNAMDATWPMYAPLTSHHRWSGDFTERLAKQGKIVLRWHADRSYSSNVIYDTTYLHSAWGRLFDILEHRRQFPLYQDLLVLRKPGKSLSKASGAKIAREEEEAGA